MSVEKYRLHSMPSAQCHVVIQHDGKKTVVELISYSTYVLRIVEENDTITLLCSGTYSNTTARHINRFTNEFFGKSLYFECKDSLKSENFVKLFNQYYSVVFCKNPDDENFDEYIYRFERTIYNYEHDDFGYGRVKKYYGSY